MKKFLFLIVISICLGISLISCESDNDGTSEIQNMLPLEAETFLEVSYGSHSEQVYDLFLPADRSTTKTKIIILVHGGGWSGGDKEDMDGFVTLVQENHPDHAVVNINYVLATATEKAFPNQFLDLGRVITKLTSEKDALQILPEFGLIGASAGAHISLMYDSVYDDGDKVKFVCDIVGPSDFTDPFYANNPAWVILMSSLIDASEYPSGSNLAEAISPVFQVSSSTSPSILFYGDQDPLVPLTNGELLESNLSNAGVTNSFTVYPGGHGNWDAASLLNLQRQLSGFITDNLEIN